MNELSLTSQWRLLCCAALEMALEKVTDQAEGEYARLKSLHGKVLCLQLSQLNWPLYLVFAKKIQVLSSYEVRWRLPSRPMPPPSTAWAKAKASPSLSNKISW